VEAVALPGTAEPRIGAGDQATATAPWAAERLAEVPGLGVEWAT
jgi:hypothetical protein